MAGGGGSGRGALQAVRVEERGHWQPEQQQPKPLDPWPQGQQGTGEAPAAAAAAAVEDKLQARMRAEVTVPVLSQQASEPPQQQQQLPEPPMVSGSESICAQGQQRTPSGGQLPEQQQQQAEVVEEEGNPFFLADDDDPFSVDFNQPDALLQAAASDLIAEASGSGLLADELSAGTALLPAAAAATATDASGGLRAAAESEAATEAGTPVGTATPLLEPAPRGEAQHAQQAQQQRAQQGKRPHPEQPAAEPPQTQQGQGQGKKPRVPILASQPSARPSAELARAASAGSGRVGAEGSWQPRSPTPSRQLATSSSSTRGTADRPAAATAALPLGAPAALRDRRPARAVPAPAVKKAAIASGPSATAAARGARGTAPARAKPAEQAAAATQQLPKQQQPKQRQRQQAPPSEPVEREVSPPRGEDANGPTPDTEGGSPLTWETPGTHGSWASSGGGATTAVSSRASLQGQQQQRSLPGVKQQEQPPPQQQQAEAEATASTIYVSAGSGSAPAAALPTILPSRRPAAHPSAAAGTAGGGAFAAGLSSLLDASRRDPSALDLQASRPTDTSAAAAAAGSGDAGGGASGGGGGEAALSSEDDELWRTVARHHQKWQGGWAAAAAAARAAQPPEQLEGVEAVAAASSRDDLLELAAASPPGGGEPSSPPGTLLPGFEQELAAAAALHGGPGDIATAGRPSQAPRHLPLVQPLQQQWAAACSPAGARAMRCPPRPLLLESPPPPPQQQHVGSPPAAVKARLNPTHPLYDPEYAARYHAARQVESPRHGAYLSKAARQQRQQRRSLMSAREHARLLELHTAISATQGAERGLAPGQRAEHEELYRLYREDMRQYVAVSKEDALRDDPGRLRFRNAVLDAHAKTDDKARRERRVLCLARLYRLHRMVPVPGPEASTQGAAPPPTAAPALATPGGPAAVEGAAAGGAAAARGGSGAPAGMQLVERAVRRRGSPPTVRLPRARAELPVAGGIAGTAKATAPALSGDVDAFELADSSSADVVAPASALARLLLLALPDRPHEWELPLQVMPGGRLVFEPPLPPRAVTYRTQYARLAKVSVMEAAGAGRSAGRAAAFDLWRLCSGEEAAGAVGGPRGGAEGRGPPLRLLVRRHSHGLLPAEELAAAVAEAGEDLRLPASSPSPPSGGDGGAADEAAEAAEAAAATATARCMSATQQPEQREVVFRSRFEFLGPALGLEQESVAELAACWASALLHPGSALAAARVSPHSWRNLRCQLLLGGAHEAQARLEAQPTAGGGFSPNAAVALLTRLLHVLRGGALPPGSYVLSHAAGEEQVAAFQALAPPEKQQQGAGAGAPTAAPAPPQPLPLGALRAAHGRTYDLHAAHAGGPLLDESAPTFLPPRWRQADPAVPQLPGTFPPAPEEEVVRLRQQQAAAGAVVAGAPSAGRWQQQHAKGGGGRGGGGGSSRGPRMRSLPPSAWRAFGSAHGDWDRMGPLPQQQQQGSGAMPVPPPAAIRGRSTEYLAMVSEDL